MVPLPGLRVKQCRYDEVKEKSTNKSNPSDKGEGRVSKYNKKSSYNTTPNQPNNQQTKPANQEPVVKRDLDKKCNLCQHLSLFTGPPGDNLHKFSKNDNVEPDSCPHLRPKSMREKDNLLRTYGFCRVCLITPLSSQHTEENCNPKLKVFMCGVDNCRIHRAVCSKHLDNNRRELEKRKNNLAKMNLSQTFFSFEHQEEEAASDAITPSFRSVSKIVSEFVYEDEEEMRNSVSKDTEFLEEPEGEPVFIYTNVLGADGEDHLIAFDTAATYSLLSQSAIGKMIRICYLDCPDKEWIHGVGGKEKVRNCRGLVPLEGNKMASVHFQVIKHLMTNRTRYLQEESQILKKVCQRAGLVLKGEFDYAREGSELKALIGIKNTLILPRHLYTTNTGLSVYQSNIRTRYSTDGYTLCFGGNLNLLKALKENKGENFISYSLRSLNSPVTRDFFEIRNSLGKSETNETQDHILTL